MERAAPASAKELAAKAWLEAADLIDLQLAPLGNRAMDALAPRAADVILDVGCGTGQTVLQLAGRVGAAGRVIGVDIAPRLLERARLRAAGLSQVEFVAGDAAQLRLPEGSLDGIFSRFGVMAFADPVSAFTHFRRLMKRNGRLAFACWRPLEDNELDLLPLQAAAVTQNVDQTPFRFSDPQTIREVLKAAGFRGVAIEPYDQAVSSGGLEAMLSVLLKVGPLGKIVRENPALFEDAERRLRAALAAKAVGGQVWLNAAIWVVSALG